MRHVNALRKILFFLSIFSSFLLSQITGDLKVALIRVSFPINDYPGVSSNGDFLYSTDINEYQCGDYAIDPPPHDKNYFKSHLKAVNNYYRSISGGKFGLDLKFSKVFPEALQSSYKLDQQMNYYNQISMDSFHEKRITELLKDATSKANEIDKINYNDYDIVIVVHPGVGQDFALPFLDPTPEDIPSTYIDPEMLIEHLGGPINFDNSSVSKGIIIPETQNHLYYDYSLFSQLANPCDVQYSITGTLALMIGFSINLPPLWDLNTGFSGVGVFALMDQGSNNGRGIIPAPPNPWTRLYAGWSNTIVPPKSNKIELIDSLHNQILKIPINDNEYFLIENRNNWFRKGVDIDSARYVIWKESNIFPPYINVLIDSSNISKDEYGVITSIPNYNLGLPGSGLLIWHIDEKIINDGINSYSVNSNRELRGIDLEEADGAQDMGFVTNLLTDPSSGYWGDMWFAQNLEYYRANSTNSMNFSSFTYPNTKSNSGANSGIYISNISESGTKMSFNLSSSYDIKVIEDNSKSILLQYDINNDNNLEFIGFGDSLWWSVDLNNFTTFHKSSNNNYQACIVQNAGINPYLLSIVFVSNTEDNTILEWFDYNLDNLNFDLKWTHEFDNVFNTQLLLANQEGVWLEKENLIIKINSSGIIVDSIDPYLFSYNSPFSSPVIFENQKIKIDQSIIKKGEYSSLSLIDLENDGVVEILATNKNSEVDAFDLDLNAKNGFPIISNAATSILVMNLFNNKNPELVYQNNNGEINILNNEGIVLDIIATKYKLVALGSFQGKKGIVTDKAFFAFIDDNKKITNEWRYPFASADNSRYLYLETPIVNNLSIIDKDLSYAYPNPSNGDPIVFRLKLGIANKIDIMIYDVAGYLIQKLNQDNLQISNSILEIPWNISKIESGIYFARVIVKGNNFTDEAIFKLGIAK